jgi:hypothetical protein
MRFCTLYKRVISGDLNNEIYVEKSDRYAALREGKVKLELMQQFSPYNFISLKIRSGIDNLNIVGYPDTDGSGVLLTPRIVYGITEKCPDKMAAWDLIKIRISDDYLLKYSGAQNCPVVTVSAVEKFFTEGNRYLYIGYDRGTIISSKPIDIDEAQKMFGEGIVYDDEYLKFIWSVVESARAEPAISSKILSIISEELSALYERTDLSVSQVSERIDNRVKILYNERK